MKEFAIVYKVWRYVQMDIVEAEDEKQAIEFFKTWFNSEPIIYSVTEV